MKIKWNRILAGVATAVFGFSMVGIVSAANVLTKKGEHYTKEEIVEMQNFLLNREDNIPEGANYDQNGDGVWNIFDLMLMKYDALQADSETTTSTLVVYFSTPEIVDATTTASRVTVNGEVFGTTEYMATVIHENTDSDIFKIELEEPYDSTVATRAKEEHDNGILPALSSHITNLDQYDTIFVGYPTWWYDMPQVMYSFFEEYDFSGKTIIPFNSHGGSSFSGSIEEIAELEPDATVLTNGLSISRGSVATAENQIIEWIQELGYYKEAEPKTLVVYFSWSGNTTEMASYIAEQTGGDLLEIEPTVPYSTVYAEVGEVARIERDENARPEIANLPESLEDYDTLLIGYPIWWHTAPMIIGTFLESYDLTGMDVYPFTQSASMDTEQFENSMEFVRTSAAGATVHDGLFVRSSDTEGILAYLTENELT